MFIHVPHPHTLTHHKEKPVKVADHAPRGLNGRIALLITTLVGSMVAGYVFAAIALISAPAAFGSHNSLIIVTWISQSFLQLFLLPVILVGQNIQGKAADARADSTWKDAESILHEALQIQAHLKEQDTELAHIIAHLKGTPS